MEKPVFQIDHDGHETRYTYNRFGKQVSITDPLGRKTTYEYDAYGNLIAHENEHARTERIFDIENRLISEALNGQTTTHEYDNLGNRTRRLSSFGNDIRFSHDILGRTTGIEINGAFFDGTERTYDYTADNQLAEQVVILPRGNTIERSYEYDPVGNLTARIDADKGSRYFDLQSHGPDHKIHGPRTKDPGVPP